MDLFEKTKKICKEKNIVPKRSKGQNFLIRESVYDDIVKFANITKKDNVLEVGPGLGFLTEKLAKKAKKVVAVELDDKLAGLLKKKTKKQGIENVEIINEDILKIKNEELRIKNYKIVANLPYNITSIFLRKFLGGDTSGVQTASRSDRSGLIVLILQKEVAERIIAKPGKMSLLAVSAQFYAKAEILQYVNRQDFWPGPEVDSAIIRFLPNPASLLGEVTHPTLTGASVRRAQGRPVPVPVFRSLGAVNKRRVYEKGFFQMVKFGFSARRKMLKNNLAGGYRIKQKEIESLIVKTGLKASIRAQELSIDDWKKLYKEILRVVEK